MLNVKLYAKTSCDLWRMAVLAGLQQHCFLGLTENAEVDGQKQSRISTSHIPAESIWSTASNLTGITVPFHLTHHSYQKREI